MKKKILVISQEGYIRDLLRRELTKEGYGVVLADTVQQAFGEEGEKVPDLALVDTVLSDIDGEEVLQRFREGSASPPIVIWSHDAADDFWTMEATIMKTRNFFKIKSKIKELCPAEAA